MKRNLTFRKLDESATPPYDLLMLADPSKEVVDRYLPSSHLFGAFEDQKLLGVIVLFPLSTTSMEIKNVAVREDMQGRGIGSYLIDQSVRFASKSHYRQVCIGTANSSTSQLRLYQKLGFELSEVRWDFFTKHYAEAIYEDGIQARHMLVLTKHIGNE